MSALAPAAAPQAIPDLAQLQGVWVSVAGPCEARMLIAGNRFSFEFIEGDVFIGTFEATEGQMDMRIEEGPAEHKDRVAQCRYQVDGGVMRWCTGRPGSGKRPPSFPRTDDPRHLSFVFRQVRRKPRRPG